MSVQRSKMLPELGEYSRILVLDILITKHNNSTLSHEERQFVTLRVGQVQKLKIMYLIAERRSQFLKDSSWSAQKILHRWISSRRNVDMLELDQWWLYFFWRMREKVHILVAFSLKFCDWLLTKVAGYGQATIVARWAWQVMLLCYGYVVVIRPQAQIRELRLGAILVWDSLSCGGGSGSSRHYCQTANSSKRYRVHSTIIQLSGIFNWGKRGLHTDVRYPI